MSFNARHVLYGIAALASLTSFPYSCGDLNIPHSPINRPSEVVILYSDGRNENFNKYNVIRLKDIDHDGTVDEVVVREELISAFAIEDSDLHILAEGHEPTIRTPKTSKVSHIGQGWQEKFEQNIFDLK